MYLTQYINSFFLPHCILVLTYSSAKLSLDLAGCTSMGHWLIEKRRATLVKNKMAKSLKKGTLKAKFTQIVSIFTFHDI